MNSRCEVVGVLLRRFAALSLKRKAVMIATFAVLVAMSITAVLYLRHPGDADEGGQIADTTAADLGPDNRATPADASDEATITTEATAVLAPVMPPAGERTTSSREQPTGRRASPGAVAPSTRIAFRLEAAVWVADEDGGDPVKVASVGDGPVALSPNGDFIAIAHEGSIALVNVSTGVAIEAGPAEAMRPAWFKDSSAVLYVRATSGSAGFEVWKLPVSGSGAQKIVDGHSPAVGSDGTIAAIPAFDPAKLEAEQAYFWVLRPGGAPSRSKTAARVNAIDVMPGRVVYATGGGSMGGTGPAIWIAAIDGRDSRRVIQGSPGDRPFGYSDLRLSPAGKHVLATLSGDDGYSRVQVIDLDTGSVTHLTVRRDTYPMGWTADGAEVRFFEGNVFQGEPSSLMGARKDGTGREVIVQGAR